MWLKRSGKGQLRVRAGLTGIARAATAICNRAKSAELQQLSWLSAPGSASVIGGNHYCHNTHPSAALKWYSLRMKSCFSLNLFLCVLGSVVLTGCTSMSNTQNSPPPPSSYQLTVSISTTSSGTVTSSPAGINCPTTCSGTFGANTQVTLTAAASDGYTFSGWSGACTGPAACSVTVAANSSVSATFTKNVATIESINHIILFAQENRSFDEYLGYMRQYWANNGTPDQQFDGLPQFTPASQCTTMNGVSSCAVPTNPGCAAATGYCSADASAQPVPSFHIPSVCTELMSSFWAEAHVDWNHGFDDPNVATLPWAGDGYVQAAANDARGNAGINDTNGYRSMGYFTDQELNYYYYMATQFGTSDRWFSPLMTRTQANRAFIYAGTSQGHVYPPGGLTATPIIEALQNTGVTWRVYVDSTNCAGQTGDALNQCLVNLSYINMFTYESQILSDSSLYQNFVPISQFANDVQDDSTLPQVIIIEPASNAGLDEHPSDSDQYPVNVQAGANFAAGLINALMTSPSWKDSAMIFTYDEAGGFYDHVQPQTVPVPDSFTSPVDLQPTDSCAGAGPQTSGVCSFATTGYRIPLIVISPFAKKNYVSHTVRDTTAWLSLVEERFNVKPLTARDGYWSTETDATTGLPGTMDEFFDFSNPPWMTPPSPPTQNQSAPCSLDAPDPWAAK